MSLKVSEAFPCPHCGHLRSKVKPRRAKIQPGAGFVKRRFRECLDCKREFTTTERIDPPRAA